MNTEEIIKMEAIIKEVIVKGTNAEPRIYPGTQFKPGETVQVSKRLPKKVKKPKMTELSMFLEVYKKEVNSLQEEYNKWFYQSYRPQPDMIPMRRDILFFQTLWNVDPVPNMWDKAFDILEVIYILDNLELPAAPREKQINAVYELLYKDLSTSLRISETKHLYPCITELDIKKITLKKFILDTIKDTEKDWL